jgi:hypothetical protein
VIKLRARQAGKKKRTSIHEALCVPLASKTNSTFRDKRYTDSNRHVAEDKKKKLTKLGSVSTGKFVTDVSNGSLCF